jgi:hypothetical protein
MKKKQKKQKRNQTMAARSLQRALGAIVLAFESFIVFFGTLVSFGLKVAAPELVWAVGLSLAVVMILTPAVLGRPGGYIFGSALQVIVLFISIWTIFRDPAGYVFLIVSIIFIGLWAWAMIAGSTIDAAKRALKRQNEQLGENQ